MRSCPAPQQRRKCDHLVLQFAEHHAHKVRDELDRRAVVIMNEIRTNPNRGKVVHKIPTQLRLEKEQK
jgi:hypothetical protein